MSENYTLSADGGNLESNYQGVQQRKTWNHPESLSRGIRYSIMKLSQIKYN